MIGKINIKVCVYYSTVFNIMQQQSFLVNLLKKPIAKQSKQALVPLFVTIGFYLHYKTIKINVNYKS